MKKLKIITLTGAILVLSVATNFGLSKEEKRAQGDAILKQMSDKLKSAQSMTFSTKETIERTKRDKERQKVDIQREIAVRRPDRLWFKATGDRNVECFYDGKQVTLVSDKDKVYGQFPAAPTLDETTDIITARYGIPMPIADLLTEDPRSALKDAKTVGGVEKQEAVGGVDCNVLSYQHPNVEFSIWIPVSGDPLPQKMHIIDKTRRGQPVMTVEFSDWNLSAEVPQEQFTAQIPKGYEAIAVIQRASAVIPEGKEPAGAEKTSTKPTQK